MDTFLSYVVTPFMILIYNYSYNAIEKIISLLIIGHQKTHTQQFIINK